MPIIIKREKLDAGNSLKTSFLIRLFAWLGVIQLSIAILLMTFIFYLGEQLYYQYPTFVRIASATFNKSIDELSSYRFAPLRMLGYNNDFPTINLDIKQKNYRKLQYTSSSNKEGTQVQNKSDASVNASLRINNKNVPIEIRLKGDRRIHWASEDNWSYRVKVRNEDTVMGMKVFSLQRPVTRNYISEWFFHTLLKQEGIIGLRYQFVSLKINGKDIGTYVLEEHFGKRLIESNSRRDGPILGAFESNQPIIGSWPPVQVYKSKAWNKNNPELLLQAVNMLEDFQRGVISVDDAFDAELLGRYMAICDVINMWHGGLGKSIKFYFNPISKKLEPIGFDGHFLGLDQTSIFTDSSMDGSRRRLRWPLDQAGLWWESLFDASLNNNKQFFKSYVRNMERLSQPGYLEGILHNTSNELERNLEFISKDFPLVDFWTFATFGSKLRDTLGAPGLFQIFPEKSFLLRRNYIAARLAPHEYISGYVSRAFKDSLQVSVRNRQSLPIEFGKFYFQGKVYQSNTELIIEGVKQSQFGDWTLTNMEVIDTPASDIKEKEGYTYRVFGAKKWMFREYDFGYIGHKTKGNIPNVSSLQDIIDLSFVKFDEASKTIIVKPGQWVLKETLAVPQGYTLTIENAQIDLTNGARIVSYSPVRFSGTNDKKVIIYSSDGTGQGLVVMNSQADSVLKNVVFKDLTILPDQAWGVTSTALFYKSNVEIDNVSFTNINAEDALNIVGSNFKINHSNFTNVSSDAFDSDFSVGSVRNTTFSWIGNDGIDVSGTNIFAESIKMTKIGDKGISVGEASKFNLIDYYINDSEMGIAVKDGSFLRAENVDTSKAKVGVAVYRKKTEYDFPIAYLQSSNIGKYLREEGVRLRVNGKELGVNSTNLKSQIYSEKE